MSEYEVGVWYGWTGGECPLHEDAEICAILRGDPTKLNWGKAKAFTWSLSNGQDDILAFRVIVDCRKPREYWINEYPEDLDGLYGSRLWESFEEARNHAMPSLIRTIHLREVMDE